MTTTHLVLRYAHISMGMLALVSGAAAMTFRKGSRPHRQSGNVFFVAMLIMAGTGAYISVFITPVMSNVIAGLLALYLTATAWATVWREPGETGGLEIGLALLGLATAISGITFGLQAANSPNGLLDESPAPFYFIFGGAALLGTALDVRMIARGGFTGAARITRHFSRMCLAMFIATASFFLGQAKLFPVAVRESGVLKAPVLLVVGALLYWLIRIRVVPLIRKVRPLRVASQG
ncbi:MAG: DUF2306 domain-containing protein [Gemmatimonadota bacterium]|nr:DUF2306 domain-containing protein [Gemmatimonadota bacterium]